MPRVPRRLVVIPDHPHHVIVRGNNRRRLFSYRREYCYFLLRLLEGSQKHGVPVHALALMTNHVHLIATPTQHERLSRFVASFSQTFAQYRNQRRGSSGKLFEERYKCVPITTEEQMATTIVYIELNPVHAGLCAEPREYRWSTFHQHVGEEAEEPLIEKLWSASSWYSSLGTDSAGRAAAYRDWFEHYRARDDWSSVYGDPKQKADGKRFERPDRKRAI